MCCFEFFGKLSLPASPLFSIALCFLTVSHRWQIIPRIFRGFSMASIVFPISHHSVHYVDNFPCSSPSHPPFSPVFFQRISWLNLRWAQLYVSLVTQNTLYCPSPDVFSFAVFSLNYISKWTSLCDKASSLFHMLPLAMFWNSTHLLRVKGCRQHKKQWTFSNKIIFVSNYVCLWKFKFNIF